MNKPVIQRDYLLKMAELYLLLTINLTIAPSNT